MSDVNPKYAVTVVVDDNEPVNSYISPEWLKEPAQYALGLMSSAYGEQTAFDLVSALSADIQTISSDLNDKMDDISIMSSLIKRDEWLYELNSGVLDYDFGRKYIDEQYVPEDLGACASMRTGNFHGRNYDWVYDNKCTVAIHVPSGGEVLHSSVSFASLPNGYDKSYIERRDVSNNVYKGLPFHVLDGINDAGVVINSNVVHKNSESGWTGRTLNPFMAVRYVLDHFDSASAAASYLKDHVYRTEFPYDLHFMISDKNGTYIVEDGVSSKKDGNRAVMTNLRNAGDVVNVDGTINIDKLYEVDPYGAGVERYNTLVSGFSGISGVDDMKSAMESAWYTNTYNNTWYSECCGEYTVSGNKHNITVKTTVDEDDPEYDFMVNVMNVMKGRYESREEHRGDDNPEYMSWQTIHSAVYSIQERSVNLRVQENSSVEYTFGIQMPSISVNDLLNQIYELSNRVSQLENNND